MTGERPEDKSRPSTIATVQVDTDKVRVTEYRFPPGAHTTWHRHEYAYVVVPIKGGKLSAFDGKELHHFELVTGQAYARPVGVEHDVINMTDQEISFIEVEMKG